MLDKKKEQMLNIAMLLTANELDEIHESKQSVTATADALDAAVEVGTDSPEQEVTDEADETDGDDSPTTLIIGITTGERERLRTRESKVSTACVGQAREPHEWWPIGTELIGKIGNEEFTATVVKNKQVKSGKSVLITCWPAQGRVCITPTRAAIEATEAYRQLAKIGRGGGVTNGWSFWKPKQ